MLLNNRGRGSTVSDFTGCLRRVLASPGSGFGRLTSNVHSILYDTFRGDLPEQIGGRGGKAGPCLVYACIPTSCGNSRDGALLRPDGVVSLAGHVGEESGGTVCRRHRRAAPFPWSRHSEKFREVLFEHDRRRRLSDVRFYGKKADVARYGSQMSGTAWNAVTILAYPLELGFPTPMLRQTLRQLAIHKLIAWQSATL